MSDEPKSKKTHFRTVWISDVHLGTKYCRAERLLHFLKSVQCDYLYLVGDIIDIWALKRKWHWPKEHTNVVRRVLKSDNKGTHVVFVPGNHDEMFRGYNRLIFGGVEINNEPIHTTADGRKAVILHGDIFDAIVANHRVITFIGDWLYDVLLYTNKWFNRLRLWCGFGHWSLSNYIKHRVKQVISFISSFEDAVVRYAHQKKVDMVVCGHIHHPEVREIDDVLYCNCGDWVENCSAIVEHFDGRIEMLRFGFDGDLESDRTEKVSEPDSARRRKTVSEPNAEPVGAGSANRVADRLKLEIASSLAVEPEPEDAEVTPDEAVVS
ncbi:MAG: UDP-2,3-diacylglucosamine diphosphatase [Planctomycetes bacterium]|nr:UDP-2,3-diacylglucosamine diphosphatase [Planctomycetota bacterium]